MDDTERGIGPCEVDGPPASAQRKLTFAFRPRTAPPDLLHRHTARGLDFTGIEHTGFLDSGRATGKTCHLPPSNGLRV